MASNMAYKAKEAETAQNNGAGSKLLLDGSKGRKGVWGTEVRPVALKCVEMGWRPGRKAQQIQAFQACCMLHESDVIVR